MHVLECVPECAGYHYFGVSGLALTGWHLKYQACAVLQMHILSRKMTVFFAHFIKAPVSVSETF